MAQAFNARDDETAGEEDDEDIDARRPVTIIVPGNHEGQPDHVPSGTGRTIEVDAPQKFIVSLADLMISGSRTILFVQDPAELPALLHATADRRLQVPRLDQATVRQVLKIVFGGSTALAVPADPDPVLLDLAFRVGDTAASYAERLNRLVRTQGRQMVSHSARDASAVAGFPARFEDVHGMAAAVSWARQLVVDLVDYRAGSINWHDVDRGAVFTGPPGTGKTRLVGLIATEAGVPLITGSAARWQQHEGGGGVQQAMAEAFRQARNAAPSILLIDELDSFWSRQGRLDHNSSYFTSVINGLLELLDGSVSREGVVVIGTTNNPNRVDPAVLRPGRLERVIEVPAPNYDAIRSIIDFYTGRSFSDAELDEVACQAIARRATGATIESWVRTMRRRARHERREPTFEDLVASIG